MIAIVVQREIAPFLDHTDDIIAGLLQWLVFLWLNAVLLIQIGVIDMYPPRLVGTGMVSLACFVLLAILFYTIREVKAAYRDKSEGQQANGPTSSRSPMQLRSAKTKVADLGDEAADDTDEVDDEMPQEQPNLAPRVSSNLDFGDLYSSRSNDERTVYPFHATKRQEEQL